MGKNEKKMQYQPFLCVDKFTQKGVQVHWKFTIEKIGGFAKNRSIFGNNLMCSFHDQNACFRHGESFYAHTTKEELHSKFSEKNVEYTYMYDRLLESFHDIPKKFRQGS